jgi:DNA-binding MarR family transcriptional regulator
VLETTSKNETGQFAFESLDRVLHEKARLGLLTALLPHKEGLSFSELKEQCSLTDGNLNKHLEKLEEADLIAIEKGMAGKRPRTTAKLTQSGRKKFLDYLAELESIVANAIALSQAAQAKAGQVQANLAAT